MALYDCASQVPFAYKEDGQDKMALVKLRCCGACALKVPALLLLPHL
jgi:hypothetical protein